MAHEKHRFRTAPLKAVAVYRVISLRGRWPHKMDSLFAYVGREWAGLAAHPLANPFAGPDALHAYLEWFVDLPDLFERLADLRADSECGRLPLACWCGDWNPGQQSIPCHAVLIAKRMAEMFPKDTPEAYW